MKKNYDPIRVPVCRCGKMAVIPANRIRSKQPAWTIKVKKCKPDNRNEIKMNIIIFHAPMWLCACPDCGIIESGGTKRAAVAAFEKAVEIRVDI